MPSARWPGQRAPQPVAAGPQAHVGLGQRARPRLGDRDRVGAPGAPQLQVVRVLAAVEELDQRRARARCSAATARRLYSSAAPSGAPAAVRASPGDSRRRATATQHALAASDARRAHHAPAPGGRSAPPPASPRRRRAEPLLEQPAVDAAEVRRRAQVAVLVEPVEARDTRRPSARARACRSASRARRRRGRCRRSRSPRRGARTPTTPAPAPGPPGRAPRGRAGRPAARPRSPSGSRPGRRAGCRACRSRPARSARRSAAAGRPPASPRAPPGGARSPSCPRPDRRPGSGSASRRTAAAAGAGGADCTATPPAAAHRGVLAAGVRVADRLERLDHPVGVTAPHTPGAQKS